MRYLCHLTLYGIIKYTSSEIGFYKAKLSYSGLPMLLVLPANINRLSQNFAHDMAFKTYS